MPSPRKPGARRGRTLTIELPATLKAAIEAAAAAQGQTLAEWTRQALAAAAAPEAQPPGPLQLQALAERLEGIAARLEALSGCGNPAASGPASDASEPSHPRRG